MYSFLSHVRPAVFNEWWNVATYQNDNIIIKMYVGGDLLDWIQLNSFAWNVANYQNIILFSEQLLYNKLDGVLWKRESYLYDNQSWSGNLTNLVNI